MTKDEFKDQHNVWDEDSADDEIIEARRSFNTDLDDLIQSEIEAYDAAQWKKYPENKPDDERDYLVQYEDSDCNEVGYFDMGKEWNTPSDGFYGEVIAFRELPKPYQEGRQSFGSLNGCHNCKHQDNDDVCKKCDDTWDKWEGGER